MPSPSALGSLLGFLIGTFLAALLVTFVVSRVLRAMFFHGISGLRRAISPTLLAYAIAPTLIAYGRAQDGDQSWPWTFLAYGCAAACLIAIDGWRTVLAREPGRATDSVDPREQEDETGAS